MVFSTSQHIAKTCSIHHTCMFRDVSRMFVTGYRVSDSVMMLSIAEACITRRDVCVVRHAKANKAVTAAVLRGRDIHDSMS